MSEAMEEILRPARVHFDTANVQDLATDQRFSDARRAFHRAIREGRMMPVLSVIHLLEIAKKPRHIRRPIAKLLAAR